jgi:aspartyl-tRNA(Asn)/glutamyl-tRNA(Gln) amidotransferase subunit A
MGITTKEKVIHYLEEIEKNNQNDRKINALLFVRDRDELIEEAEKIDKKIKSRKAGKLAGKVIAVKSNINVRGLPASCASKVLEDYEATYDATVIKMIKDEDGLIVGMANMDEFASGSSGETSAFGPTKNPVDLDLIPGGSSSGSAAAVAAGFCDMALGSDTGGSIRNPASHCGVVGVKPSYASVSRYGLIDLSMSLDQIGSIAKNVSDAALLLSVIRGKDERDSISEESKTLNLKNVEKNPGKITVGVLNLDISDERIKSLIKEKVDEILKKKGWKEKSVKIKNIDLAIETYYPLVYVEFFSGTRKLDGRRYGKKIEEVAGPEVLRRILGGSEISKEEYGGRYYQKALKVKDLIAREFSEIFKDVDCVILPTVPRLPHKIGSKISVEEMYGYDALTIPSNLAGNCSISIPVGKIEGVPVGMQIMCDKMQDEKMFQIAREFEKEINYF